VSNFAVPLIIGLVTDAIYRRNMDDVIKYTVHWMIPIVLGSAIFTWVRGTTFNTMGVKIAKEVRYDLFYFTINKDISFFDENKTGDILSRISVDTSVIEEGLGMNISMLMRNLIQLICNVLLMLFINPELTGVLFAGLLPTLFIMGYMMKFVKTETKNLMAAKGKIGNIAEEAIGNYRTVKAFASEDEEIRKFREANEKAYVAGSKIARVLGF